MKATQKDVAGRLSSLLLVGLALLAAACTEDDEEAQPLPPPAAVYTCTATLAPFTVNYQLGDGGRMLVMAPGTATEDTLERLTAAGPRVQGTWLLADQPGVPSLRVELQIETARLSIISRCGAKGKTVVATASSPATITDTTISVLQSAIDVQYIR